MWQPLHLLETASLITLSWFFQGVPLSIPSLTEILLEYKVVISKIKKRCLPVYFLERGVHLYIIKLDNYQL